MGWAERTNEYNKARPINLWLDDYRPAPSGWLHVKTVADAKLHLEARRVRKASLDHDLGACETCMDGKDIDEWLEASDCQSMPHCDHVGTGYDLCLWMAETGHWPMESPTVHSANPVGRDRMRGVIARYFKATESAGCGLRGDPVGRGTSSGEARDKASSDLVTVTK